MKKSNYISKALAKQYDLVLCGYSLISIPPNLFQFFSPLFASLFLRENQMSASLFSLQESMPWTDSKLESPGHVCILPRPPSQERNVFAAHPPAAQFKIKVHTSEN